MKKYPNFARAMCAVALWLFLFPVFAAPQDKPDIFVQLGHSDFVECVAFSPDGRTVVSGGRDQTLKLWDVASGRELKTLSGHGNRVDAVAFAPDGRTLASGSGDKTIKLWDVASGRELRTLSGHTSSVDAIAFSPDGRTVVSGSADETIKFWDVASGRELKTLKWHLSDKHGRQYVSAVAFSPSGRTVIAGNEDSTLKLWDVASGREIRVLSGHSKAVSAVAFSPNGRNIISASKDQTLKLWDVTSGRELKTLRGHTKEIKSVAFSPDGRTVVSDSSDQTLKLWDVTSGRELKTFNGNGVTGTVAFSPDGRALVSGGASSHAINTIKLWDVASGREIRTLGSHNSDVYVAAFSPNGRTVVSGSWDKTLKLWDVASGRKLHTLSGHNGRVYAVAYSPDGRTVASGNEDKTLKLWDVASGRELRTLIGHTEGIDSVAFSPDGRAVASGSSDKTIKLWDVASGRELRTLSGVDYFIHAVAFSPDGRTLASGSDHGITLWDVASGRALRTLRGDDRYWWGSKSVVFSPDGRTVVSASREKIRYWDVTSGQELRTLDGHTSNVTSVAFSPDGHTAVSGSWDNTLKLWDVASGREIMSLRGHTNQVRSVAFSPDGRTVMSGSEDGSLRLWAAATGKDEAMFVDFKDGEWIAITPEGYYTGSEHADKYLNVRIGNKVYGVDQYREKFYRPDLVKLALAGKPLTGMASIGSVKPAPSVSIVDTPASVGSDEATIKVKVADQGGGVGDVRVYLNGSAVSLDRRNLAVAAVHGKAQVFSYKVRLVSGKNALRAIAFNAENSMQSTDALHVIEASIAATKPSLYAVVVGIQEYVNPKLTLKYSVADANLFADTIKAKAGGLFEKVEITRLVTAKDTTHPAIATALKTARAKVRPDDLFVFYVASHGTVDEGEYYLVTSNVGSTSTEKLKRDALSQNSLKELIANIPATKKLIVLDTCNAGKLGDTLQVALLTRGMNEDTAFKILSRAVGSTILSAATSQQEALEGYQNHGLFTWVLAEGLNGAADLDKDGFIKTIELASYVDEKVPELAEKVFRHKQFPVVAPSGQAFPIVRVK